MIKRPQSNETEEDILRMQQEFLKEKSKNPKMQPAAQIVKIQKPPKKSLFAQSRAKASAKETFALEQEAETSKELLGDIHDKIVGTTQPIITDIVLGDIVEKQVVQPKEYKVEAMETDALLSFPIAQRSSLRNPSKNGKSIFALAMETHEQGTGLASERKRLHDTHPMQYEPIEKRNICKAFGDASVIVEDAKTATSVHQENLELLGKMREEEILDERRKLLDSIDPSLVALLAKRRQDKALAIRTKITPAPMTDTMSNASMEISIDNTTAKLNQNELEISIDNTTTKLNKNELEIAMDSTTAKLDPNELRDFPASNAAIKILQRSSAEQWINFDVVEKDKLEWMRDVPTHIAKLKEGEKFEARFDWKGVLLPYSTESQQTAPTQAQSVVKDERELYLHGEEPHRPGYTLQELFRLARSNVMQQRISAFGAIAGILNIYNQGFYDHVLELPITKIFFLLRFGFDDNSPAMLEVVSKALAFLFYNETDETLLDFIYDNPGCHWQPTLKVTTTDVNLEDPTSLENLQKQMQQLQLNAAKGGGAAISAKIDETEEESRTSMSDFQLAETDLIDCLLRTDILQRIYFILNNVHPDNSTVSSCFKLLIRLARSGKAEALKIVKNEELIQCLLDNFLPGLEKVDTNLNETPFYNYPQYLCLKLIRILVSQSLVIANKLIEWKIVDKLQNYLYCHDDIKGKLIKVQTESLRIVRCLLLLRIDNALYKKFLSAFRYMLEWHFNHVIYEVGGPLLIRQHAAALLAAITSSSCNLEVAAVLGDALHDCCCSWFYKATKNGVNEFSQATLLSTCLNAVTWFTRSCDALERFRSFHEKYLPDFIASEVFVQLIGKLHSSSIILRDVQDRRLIHAALPNAGSVLLHKLGPQLIVPQTYGVYFMCTLWRLLELHIEKHKQRTLIDLLIRPQIVEPIVQYLNEFTTRTNHYLATNFFAKSEIRLIYGFLCFEGFATYLKKAQMLQITYNFLCCLTAEHIPEIEQLFERVIFNREYITADAAVLKKWRSTCLELVYPHYIVVPSNELTLSMPCMQAPILPTDWPYFQLKIILQNYIDHVQQKPATLFSEREVMQMTLTFVSLLEECNPELQIATPTEKLMYNMILFMGPDAQFLEPDMRVLLRNHLLNFYEQCKDCTFDFDAVYEGKCKFENLYALFVDHFQAASYGDELFGSLVLVPMAQKYDNKWRRRVWSDYAAVLRFLDCDDNMILGGLQAYLEPAEQEESLLKAYVVAMKTKLVRPNTVPYKIAEHHVTKFKEQNKFKRQS